LANEPLLVDKPNEADWHYLPVFWTRWHLSHNYGQFGIEDLQQIVDNGIVDDTRTFTICQYDDGPLVDLGMTVQFLASRKTSYGADIPLLCSRHSKPWMPVSKKYLASFTGRLANHSIRGAMMDAFSHRADVRVCESGGETVDFVRQLLQSRVALAPRGYGGSSFRFYEAMQLGVVPLLISDLDTRPFQRFLPWQTASLYAKDTLEAAAILDSIQEREIKAMSRNAASMYKQSLAYQQWCRYVVDELRVGVV
jgi:hypothetical protein